MMNRWVEKCNFLEPRVKKTKVGGVTATWAAYLTRNFRELEDIKIG